MVSIKAMKIILILLIPVSTRFCPASADGGTDVTNEDFAVRVYLPREVVVKDNHFSLGQVGVVRGDEPFVSKANEVALGRISMPCQKVVIDRSTILSRLACSGIPPAKVRLTGAESVTVEQQREIIKGSEFVDLARSFLNKGLLADSVCQLDPVRMPPDLVMPGKGEEIKLSPCLVERAGGNRATVQIVVLAGGEPLGTRDVTFRLKHNCRRAVAMADIPAGAAISPENVEVEQVLSDYSEPGDWRPPYGLIAKRRIAANSVIRSHMVGPARPQVVLKRNQTVVIRIDRPGLLVTALGRTVQEGHAGEYIKVRNLDSRRIILAKVNDDGTVEPVF
ncbi:MAG: flagellar basal body P-ring formation chaperone FlgA [Planctomycetota bacterium]|jgi:flagella basal body P-ring formation protein FlgA